MGNLRQFRTLWNAAAATAGRSWTGHRGGSTSGALCTALALLQSAEGGNRTVLGIANLSTHFHSTSLCTQQAEALEEQDDEVLLDPPTAKFAPAIVHPDGYTEALSAQEGPIVAYKQGRLQGLYRQDTRQEYTIMMLQNLFEQLMQAQRQRRIPRGLTMMDTVQSSPGKSNWWSKMTNLVTGTAAQPPPPAPQTKGLYMFGGVGCGKTMLMDLFVHAAPPEFKVHRSHFHDFMIYTHTHLRMHSNQKDPLTQVANDISREYKVLCLDEFFVTDVADAMILNRLFGRLWDMGLVLVATSNRKPDALYEGGLQRHLFLPFIDRLKEQCIIHDMHSPTDYRRLAQHKRGLYFVAGNRGDDLYQRFIELANNQTVGPKSVAVAMGRRLDVRLAAGGCVAWFEFEDLCGRPLGAADYIGLANSFHTLTLNGVPVFTAANRAAAYRFVTLVDVLYEHKVRLLCSAEAMPHELFENILLLSDAASLPADKADAAVIDDNLGFAKERTISRLTEMQSKEYLMAHAHHHAPELLLALKESGS